MARITPEEVEKLAELSRIRLTAEEKIQMTSEISSILSYVDQLKEVVDARKHEEKKYEEQHRASQIGPRNVLREDELAHPAGEFTADIISAAPKKSGNYIQVKKIL